MGTSSQGVSGEIRRIVRHLVAKFAPEKVILFGSHARGEANSHSDVDLLLVVPIKGSKREKQLQVRMALPASRLPVDVLVTRPEDFAWRKDVVGTIEWPASHEGKVLYARS